MTERLTCDLVDEHDLVARFVTARLTDAEAEALEAHCLACERCWSELRLALKVHAAAEPTGTVAAPVPTPAQTAALAAAAGRPRPWLWAAAAAVVLAVSASWLLQRQQLPPEIARSGLPLERVAASVRNGTVVITWPAVDKASRYIVSIVAVDGRLVAQQETTMTRAEFDVSTVAVSGAQASVEVYSALGDRIASSAPTPLPSRSTR